MAPYRTVEKAESRTLICDWCGKEVVWAQAGLPPDWAKLDYDTNKYTPKIDPALVCSRECERRLAQSFAAGGNH